MRLSLVLLIIVGFFSITPDSYAASICRIDKKKSIKIGVFNPPKNQLLEFIQKTRNGCSISKRLKNMQVQTVRGILSGHSTFIVKAEGCKTNERKKKIGRSKRNVQLAFQLDCSTSNHINSYLLTATPTETPLSNPTSTPEITATQTPTVTRTSTPTITPTPTATVTPPLITESKAPCDGNSNAQIVINSELQHLSRFATAARPLTLRLPAGICRVHTFPSIDNGVAIRVPSNISVVGRLDAQNNKLSTLAFRADIRLPPGEKPALNNPRLIGQSRQTSQDTNPTVFENIGIKDLILDGADMIRAPYCPDPNYLPYHPIFCPDAKGGWYEQYQGIYFNFHRSTVKNITLKNLEIRNFGGDAVAIGNNVENLSLFGSWIHDNGRNAFTISTTASNYNSNGPVGVYVRNTILDGVSATNPHGSSGFDIEPNAEVDPDKFPRQVVIEDNPYISGVISIGSSDGLIFRNNPNVQGTLNIEKGINIIVEHNKIFGNAMRINSDINWFCNLVEIRNTLGGIIRENELTPPISIPCNGVVGSTTSVKTPSPQNLIVIRGNLIRVQGKAFKLINERDYSISSNLVERVPLKAGYTFSLSGGGLYSEKSDGVEFESNVIDVDNRPVAVSNCLVGSPCNEVGTLKVFSNEISSNSVLKDYRLRNVKIIEGSDINPQSNNVDADSSVQWP